MSLTFNFNSLRRIAFSFVALLLCFVLILAPFRVSAVAGVDDALFWILVAILGASGISFVSLSDAHTQCDSFYNSLSDSIKDTLMEKANLIAGSSAIVSGVKVGMQFYAEQWQQLTSAIISKFGNKGTISAVNNYETGRKLDFNNLNDKFMAYSYYNVGQITANRYGNLIMTTFTSSDFANVVNYLTADQIQNLNLSGNKVYRNFDIGCGLFTTYDVISSYNTVNTHAKANFEWQKDRNNYIYDVGFQSASYLHQCCKYFKGYKVHYTDTVTDGIHYITIYTDNLSNIVDLITGTLVGTSISVPSSVVSRQGVWTGEEWARFLNDLMFGNDISGLINCDPSAYPGIDEWHDGIGQDVATVDNPVGSIGISVPTSNDDVIDLSPSTARDYDGTTVKDKDITTTSNPGDTDNDDDTNTKPKKDTPSKILPGLSLPEILFKHKFPFCLPYDIYAMCLGLRSDNAEPPVFSIPYKNDTLNIDLEYEIDFEDFDEVISILRFFVGATFTVGLIFATRKLIWK